MDFQPGNTSGISTAGAMGTDELAELQKSLEAGYETDVDGMTGGSALRIQSLDLNLQATVQQNHHFVLFNMLPKPRATAVLDEWTEQHDIGGFLGSTFNTQDGAAQQTNGNYERMVGQVKYMTTYRSIPIVLQRQNNIVDATAIETTNGTKQLLTDIEFTMFEGDSSVVPLSFDGIYAQINSLDSDDHIIDLAGAPLNSIDAIATAAEVIYGYGNFGRATDIFIPPSVQTDLNQDLDPAFRVLLNQGAQNTVRGTSVSGIQTTYGEIKTRNDVFIRDDKLKKPFETVSPALQAIAAANAFKPATVTPTAVATEVGSAWQASQAGNYYYAVAGINQNGQSQALVSAQVAVVSGGAVSLAIAASAGGTETGYVIYRGRLNGTNALTDMREMIRIPKATGGTTTYVDTNSEIPGSTRAYILNLAAEDHAIAWRQYLPMMKIPMAAVNSPIIPWLQMICGYLRITKRNQHVVVKNIVPTRAAWKPFG
ncbi:hypothetical protein [Pararobbsia silviterrae]|uniref:Major capsid protein n=1 Tax=Pararobbsia silviterrae TaxID=1792498 RepID=A0A494X4R3_9BURK|nr:hypothetical protein [Pararobbsia silviterrae]RKP44671.1 hypothetical protein D7S86_26945 [Pararobbsia silviterrae]